MAISDMILKARVNMALIRDPRVGALDIGVTAENGVVTLRGDVDSKQECRAAVGIVRAVDGVRVVHNKITCGGGGRAEDVEFIIQRFLEKLDDEWANLPDKHALAQADYLRWGVWMAYKFRIPDSLRVENADKRESDAVDQALAKIAGNVGVPKVSVALEMLRQAESIADSADRDAPEIRNAPLVATPQTEDEDEEEHPLAA